MSLTEHDVDHAERVVPDGADGLEVVPVLGDDLQHVWRRSVRHPGVGVEHPAELVIVARAGSRKCLPRTCEMGKFGAR